MLTPNRDLIVSACVLILTASLTAYASGAGSEVWDMDRDELSLRLRTGDYEFLKNIDFSASDRSGVNLREARRLGDDAFHMLGLIYVDLDLPLSAGRLFRLSWKEDIEPWRRESLLELLRLLEVSEQYPELEELARAGRDRYGDEPEILRYLISALYRQERDAEVIAFSAVLDELASGSGSTEPPGSELALWLAVSSSRLRLPGWEDRYRALFADHRADQVHSRVWDYLQADPDIASRFSPVELLFFEAKQLLAEGRAVDATARFSQVADASRELLLSPSGLLDFYLAGSISGRQSATAARMTAIAREATENVATGDIARQAFEYAGRLYRTAGNYRSAIAQLERSLLIQPSGTEAERVRWYLLSSRVRLDPVGTARSLAAVTPTLGDPAYYSDLFAELAIRLAGLGRWDVFLEAYQATRDFATVGTRAAYELVLAEAVGQGRLPTSSLQCASLRTAYLQMAAAQSEDLFSALVASALLDQSGEAVIQAAQAAEAVTVPASGVGSVPVVQPTDAERLLTSQLRYGLLDRAYATARENAGLIRLETLMQLSDALTASGRIRESIQVGMRIVAGDEADRGPGDTGDLVAADVFQRRYPLGFATVFDEVLSQESIDRWVLFALVREESLFDPEIVSGAGAIGLTQLLPATANDVARRMRIDPPNLTDPLQNLRVGARYLAMLDAQFGGLVKAIAAYNAGQGRVRSWERQRPGLDGILFHQSVPFEETYNHIRNIVVSAVYYGYLYEGRSPTDTIRIVFGEFQTVGE